MRTFVPRVPRRRALLAGVACCALAFAGVAAADGMFGGGSAALVSATFNATTLAHSHTSTCTAANGDSITKTDAWFTGTATSTDPHLNGPATIHIRSVYDAKTSAGSVVGDVKIDTGSNTPPGKFHASLQAVNVNGNLQGFLSGNSGWGTSVLGGFSAAFSTTGGFTNGVIGSGTPTNYAILVTGGCSHNTPPPPATTSGTTTTTTTTAPVKHDDDQGEHHHHHH
jgi:hypothetical protein